MTPLIVTQSDSAGGMVRRSRAGHKGTGRPAVISVSDNFANGPLHPSDSPEAFFEVRRRYYTDDLQIPADALGSLGAWFTDAADAIRADRPVEIWYTDCVAEIIHLLVAARLFQIAKLDRTAIVTRCFETEPSARGGLSSLSEAQMRRGYDAATVSHLAQPAFDALWPPLSAPDLQALSAALPAEDSPLSRALHVYLKRFPAWHDGLGSMERALLAATPKEWTRAARMIGPAFARGMPPKDDPGDHVLFRRLVALSQEDMPWFEIRGDTAHMRSCEARLTSSGQGVCTRFDLLPLG